MNNQEPITKHQTMKRPFDLEERTTQFAKSVIRLCQNLPFNPINQRLVSQVVGATGSIGANYREANDALDEKDLLQRIRISRREAKESLHWLELILEANQSKRSEIQALQNEAIELKKILSSIIKKLERRNQK